MTTTNITSAPYYDDFSADAGYHQILFNPGSSVQARELTQIQSILRDQIAKFGGHVFKHGSVVLPGNSTSDLTVCYVRLQTTSFNVSSLVGLDVTGSTSGLRAKIRFGVNQTASPASLYVSYYNTGTNGEQVFLDGETLTVATVATTFTTAASAACGGASMAFVNRGVFFVNGSFVTVLPQSVVLGDTSTPSCHVLLKIDETIVTSDQDSTLLDPAQGSNNYAAPGGDRLKIALTLTSLPLGSVIGDDYIELMRYDSGILLEHSRYPKYNELEKSLARRTYDESGDYVVSGLKTTVREHLKRELNGGRYDLPTGDIAKMIYTVSPGKAYVHGFELENIAPTELIVNKARDASHVTNTIANIVPAYGQTLFVTTLVSLPDFLRRETVTLFNASTGGASIGTASAIAVDFVESNTTDNNAIYKLFISDITFTGGNDMSDIGRITFTGGSATVLQKLSVSTNNAVDFVLNEVVTSGARVATVHKFTRASGALYVFKHASASETPFIGDSISAPSTANGKITSAVVIDRNVVDNLLVKLPTDSTYRVKNSLNASDISYKIFHTATVTITGGAGSFSVTGMTIDPREAGNFLITSATGVHPLSTATVAGDGLSVSFAGISPASTTLRVICAATKTGASGAPKTKTLVTSFTQAGLTPAATVQLSQADGVRLRSVVSTVDGDVTSRYRFDNGQRDYAYLRSALVLTGTAPTGTLTVVYDYFTHNAGSGDYFSIDSYESSGLAEYYESSVLRYVSQSSGQEVDLRDVLDFRPRVGTDGTFTGVGNSTSNAPQTDSRVTTSIQQYVGRVDAIVLTKGGKLEVIQGTPAEQAKQPSIPSESLHLITVNVPAYTYSASDVRFVNQNNRVYTMRDVGTLEKRLANVEDYVLLTEEESNVINYDIIDSATGLSRFKSGYLVDSFKDADKISDTFSSQWKAAYVSENIVPQFEIIHVPLTQVSSTAVVTGGLMTAPYTNVALARQPMSSRVTNINPFSVFSWTGDLKLVPSRDSWVVIEDLPPNFTTSSETIAVTRPWGQSGTFGSGGSSLAWMGSDSNNSGGGGKVICAELYRQGRMDKTIYELDEAFGELLSELDPQALAGYQVWANVIVKLMKRSTIFSSIVQTIATPWSLAMAREMGYGEGSKVGSFMMTHGLRMCRFIGKFTSK